MSANGGPQMGVDLMTHQYIGALVDHADRVIDWSVRPVSRPEVERSREVFYPFTRPCTVTGFVLIRDPGDFETPHLSRLQHPITLIDERLTLLLEEPPL
jgi:hypothetical protein